MNLRLKSLKYNENVNNPSTNPWELTELLFGEKNLIVGRNATGKTRIINVLNNLSKLIHKQIIFNGEWITSFEDHLNREFIFSVSIESGQVIHELIIIDSQKKLIRNSSTISIYSDKSKSWHDISPPNDRLVLHVRRDKNEYPFLEDLILWAAGVRGFAFANTSPSQIEIPGNPIQLTSLNAVPSALEQLSGDQLKNVLKKLEYIGYKIETAITGLLDGLSPTTKIVFLKEQGLSKLLKQFEISQGMFRAFSLLTIIEMLQSSEDIKAILVDDLGEGLDFERSKKLAELIFQENLKSKIQFILTSNDAFLMNTIPLEFLTICYKSSPSTIKCLNYLNSKEKFDSWRELGLNNFDLFSSNFLLEYE